VLLSPDRQSAGSALAIQPRTVLTGRSGTVEPEWSRPDAPRFGAALNHGRSALEPCRRICSPDHPFALRTTMQLSPLTLVLLPLAGILLQPAADRVRPAEEAPRKTVAVLTFDNHSGQTRFDPLGKGLAAMMITDLTQVGSVQIVERERLQDLINEKKLQQTGYFDPATAVAVGRFAGAEYVVTGALSALEPTMRIDTRVIHVGTAEVVKAAHVVGTEDRFFELQQKLSDALIDGLELVLSPEEMQKLREQQEANRIEEMETMLVYSEALDRFDREDYVGALEKMHFVVQRAPQSALVQLTYDLIKKRAEQKARRQTRDALRGLIRRTIP
jgi:curli biogenesis system outer membrane secretion channel CsgG